MKKNPDDIENPIDVGLYNLCDEVSPIFHKYNFTPNMITSISNMFAVIVIMFLLQKKYVLASLFVIVSYFFDCLDGFYARKYKMTSTFGYYYDSISDACKLIGILFTMYFINRKKFLDIIPIITLFFIALEIQLSCQKKLYSDSKDVDVKGLTNSMRYLRFFGSGTFVAVLSYYILNFS